MPYSTVTVNGFRGLNLRDDPQELGDHAFDLLNVELDDNRGLVRTRNGWTLIGTRNPVANFRRITLWALPSTVVFFSYSGNNVQVDTGTTPTNIGSFTGALGGATFWTSDTRFGTPTAEYLFVATNNGTLQRITLAAIVASVGSPRFVAVSPFDDNRLVQANYTNAANSPTGANGGNSAVFFSDPGAPETYSANNYVHLQPGDGEEISAMCSWRDYLLVFKETKMFVFYGLSIDSAGNPVFNWRGPIPLPSPLQVTVNGSRTVAAPEGVYVVLGDGIYLTTGDAPRKISDLLHTSPITHVSYADNRLHVHRDGSTHMFVLDTETSDWLKYQSAVSAETPTNVLPTVSRGFFVAAGPSWYSSIEESGKTADGTFGAGNTAIASHYQAGFADLGSTYEKRVRQMDMWGIGSPTLDVFTDHATSDPLSRGAAITLGTSPAVDQGWHRNSYQGTLFSHKLSASSGAWQANRITYHVADQRVR